MPPKTRPIRLEVLEDRTLLNASPELIADINQSMDLSFSSPRDFVVAGDTMYFNAWDGIHGWELWKSDGTPEGTELVKDITPIAHGNNRGPEHLTLLNGTLFFVADDGVHGKELWKSDGTEEGTVMVRDIDGSRTSNLTNVNGTLFFTSSDDLWKSDGTEEGTVLVKDLYSGYPASNPSELTNVNGTLFFRTTQWRQGTKLWKSDGTEEGTVLIKEFDSDNAARYLTDVNGTLFFNGGVQGSSRTLWTSDGTSEGTKQVEGVASSARGPAYLVNFDDSLYFRITGGLWKCDGTSEGTEIITDNSGMQLSRPAEMTEVDGTLFFTAFDEISGTELWKSDGTSQGTMFVKDVNPGEFGSYPDHLTNVNGTLYFGANEGNGAWELWKSDGSAAGTERVKEMYKHPVYSNDVDRHFTNFNGTLFFSAIDETFGRELWKSNGTEYGTALFKDINQTEGNANVSNITRVNETLFFTANDGVNGKALWKSDGTTAGTVMLKDVDSSVYNLTSANGTLFFVTGREELWKSDGTTEGTVVVKDFSTDAELRHFNFRSAHVGRLLFFTAGENGRELWKSDGTEEGTVLVKDFDNTGHPNFFTPFHLTNVNGTLFFSAGDGHMGARGRELWKSDGTEEGTVLVKDLVPGGEASYPSNLISFGGQLYFSTGDEYSLRNLWKSDGTRKGTVQIREFTNLRYGTLVVAAGKLFFGADDGIHGSELWMTDGTKDGTVLVRDINSGSVGSFINGLTDVNGRLFFNAFDGINGNELWTSDGTNDGTFLVKEIRPGADGSNLGDLTNVDGTLFFWANDESHGSELWKSDGTDAGTVMVEDMMPGRPSASPSDLTELNGQLFFSASTMDETNELFGIVTPLVQGTDGDDIIRVKVTNSFEVTINGKRHFISDGSLTIDGLGGQDKIVIEGTNGDETLFANPGSFRFVGSGLNLIGKRLEHLVALGNGGNDKAVLVDSSGDERVVAKVNNTFVRDLAATFTHRVKDFGNVVLRSLGPQTGKLDLANLYDSPNKDTFVGSGRNATISSPGYRVRTEGYDRNEVRSTLGGDDVAILNGTGNGNEIFRAKVTDDPSRNFALFRSGNGAPVRFLNRVTGFSQVTGNSKGGKDKAFLIDGKGKDVLVADAIMARLSGVGYQFTVNQFHRVNTRATNGGTDSATLVDGSGNDRLNGMGKRATLIGDANSFVNATIGFENVTGNAIAGGNDRLNLASDITFQFFEEGNWEL